MDNIKQWCSDKENLKILFMLFMAIVLVVVLKNRFGEKAVHTSGSSSAHYESGMDDLTHGSNDTSKPEKAPSRLKQVTFHGLKPPPTIKRDIFAFRISQNSSKREVEQKDTGLKLNATITDDREPLAIIGSEVLGIGDVVQGFMVTAIKNDEAVLMKNGIHYTLRMAEE